MNIENLLDKVRSYIRERVHWDEPAEAQDTYQHQALDSNFIFSEMDIERINQAALVDRDRQAER
jgi:hypothetical protein